MSKLALVSQIPFCKTLVGLVKRKPPKDKKLLVIGTTSKRDLLKSMDLLQFFNVHLEVPKLRPSDMKEVLKNKNSFDAKDIDSALQALGPEMPIKSLLMMIDMAIGGKEGKDAIAIHQRHKKIDINYYYDCLRDIGPSTQYYNAGSMLLASLMLLHY